MSPRMSAHQGLKPPEKTRSVPVDGKSMAASSQESHSPRERDRFDSRSATDGLPGFSRASGLSVPARPLAGYVKPLVPTATACGATTGAATSVSRRADDTELRVLSASESEKNVNNMYAPPNRQIRLRTITTYRATA